MEPRKYDFVRVTLEPEDYEKVREVYRLHKEQARILFSLDSGIDSDEKLMELLKEVIANDIVLLAVDLETNKYAAMIGIENIKMFNNEIISMQCHIVVSKRYWGPESRNIIYNFYDWLEDNMKPVRRIEAFVPSNAYGIIKLLKDVGFKIEGTLKNRLVYYNKNNIPTTYNELVYSKMN